MIRCLSLLLLIAGLGGCGRQQDQAPDLSTPQSALRALMAAIDRRDGQAVSQCLVPQDDAQRRYVTALVEVLAASNKLYQAAATRWGRDEAKQLLGGGGTGADQLRRFDEEGQVSIQGDEATLSSSAGLRLRLRRDKNQWKIVPGTGRLAAHSESPLTDAAATLSQVAAALNAAADGVAAGTLKDVDQARQMVATSAFARPTPQAPTTQKG